MLSSLRDLEMRIPLHLPQMSVGKISIASTLVHQRSHGVKVMPMRIPSGLNMRVTV